MRTPDAHPPAAAGGPPAATLAAATLELAGVRHEYPQEGGRRLSVVDDVSLTVRSGECVALIGPSGCGKSTLIRIAAGLLRPSGGAVRIEGQAPEVARRRRMVGVVFQEPALVPWRSTLQNVVLASELAGVGRRERERQASELLHWVGLGGFEKFVPAQLSGGMKQRAAMARALMLKPRLLVMDEPFGALDQITRERLQSELSSTWARAEVSCLFVTHAVEEAVFMSDRVVVLTPAPTRAWCSVEVPEERPRSDAFRSSEAFFERCCSVRNALRGATVRDHGERGRWRDAGS